MLRYFSLAKAHFVKLLRSLLKFRGDKCQVTIIFYSAFNNANCVKAALHQLDVKLGGFTSALQYLDGERVCQNSVVFLWPDKISSLNQGCSRIRLSKGLIWFLSSCPDGRLGDRVFTGDQSLGFI